MKRSVTIMGIDPGLANAGFGVIETDGVESRFVECGTIKTPSNADMPLRLMTIQKGLREVVTRNSPELCGVETLYFARNTTSAIEVAQARGASLVTLAEAGVDLIDITPLQIKKALVGYGRAEKRQVQRMVQTLLKLEALPRPDHAADALAVAIACGNSLRRRRVRTV